ncbi:unnamed protein product [Spirodela intermedia]|uniref:Uncharacterized protein n=1 Tax=Spirodela intermedia TaxID=51605 RepID=A0A7I8IGJ4_SPIIN|nr:unnamed protein product [Spirodela intermedia]CAA6656193.1 unnamed protein product [Spirodela intermedia]
MDCTYNSNDKKTLKKWFFMIKEG